jgi:hypothetical protein
MSSVGTPEWDRLVNEYLASLEGKTPAQLMHASCDHAYGYCAHTPDNAFKAVTA